MSDWFSRLFSHDDPQQYQFGRGINASVNPREPELYNSAAEAFEEGRVLDAYEAFLMSLQTFHDDHPDSNVTIERTEELLTFELLQGSLIVRGRVTEKLFEADALIAEASGTNVAIKRHLIERNYQLTYSRYYVHEGRIHLKIYLDNTTMSPQKVFYPLRELALNGDYEKEFIASEFDAAALLEMANLLPIPEEEKRLKHRMLQEWVAACKEDIRHLPTNDNAGMIAFTYLTLLMQVDYLILPRKMIGREIMRHINEYFSEDEKGVEEKNTALESYITELGARDYESLASQLYRVTLTFSPMERASHDEIASFIEETFSKVRWYKSNRYPRVIMTIYRYIPLYLLFNFGIHPSLQKLLHLLVRIQHSAYFAALGFTPLYDPVSGKFEKRTIVNRVTQALKPYRDQFPQLEDFSGALNFTDLEKFSYSFLLQVKHLDYSEL